MPYSRTEECHWKERYPSNSSSIVQRVGFPSNGMEWETNSSGADFSFPATFAEAEAELVEKQVVISASLSSEAPLYKPNAPVEKDLRFSMLNSPSLLASIEMTCWSRTGVLGVLVEFMQPATIKFKVESKFSASIPSPFDGVLRRNNLNSKVSLTGNRAIAARARHGRMKLVIVVLLVYEFKLQVAIGLEAHLQKKNWGIPNGKDIRHKRRFSRTSLKKPMISRRQRENLRVKNELGTATLPPLAPFKDEILGALISSIATLATTRAALAGLTASSRPRTRVLSLLLNLLPASAPARDAVSARTGYQHVLNVLSTLAECARDARGGANTAPHPHRVPFDLLLRRWRRGPARAPRGDKTRAGGQALHDGGGPVTDARVVGVVGDIIGLVVQSLAPTPKRRPLRPGRNLLMLFEASVVPLRPSASCPFMLTTLTLISVPLSRRRSTQTSAFRIVGSIVNKHVDGVRPLQTYSYIPQLILILILIRRLRACSFPGAGARKDGALVCADRSSSKLFWLNEGGRRSGTCTIREFDAEHEEEYTEGYSRSRPSIVKVKALTFDLDSLNATHRGQWRRRRRRKGKERKGQTTTVLRILLEEKKNSTSSVPAFPTGSLPTAATNSADGLSSSSSPSTTSPRPPPPAPSTRRSLLVELVGAALCRRYKKKQEQTVPVPAHTRARGRGHGAALIWLWHRAGARCLHPRDSGWDGGHGHRLCGRRGVGVGVGSSQTHGADVPSTAPWVLQLVADTPTRLPVNHARSSSGPPAPPRSPSRACACARTRSLVPRRGWGTGMGVWVWVRLRARRTTGTPCLRTRHSPFESESESPLYWQDDSESALAEAESRPTSMDASPYGASNDGYGVSRSESNEYRVVAVAATPTTAAPRPSTARSTRGEELGGVRPGLSSRRKGLEAVGV
ncbi:hypothetical protein B0H13DRAFT_2268989 [Mycena leptocephala]|nr:hypothetical protein B0H13DRAFT_2268989 [Mycena leptocephala]